MRGTSLTSIVALTFTACAMDIGAAEQSLDNVDGVVVIDSEHCFRVPGDFTHPDPLPPPPIVGDFDDLGVFELVHPEEDFPSLVHAEFMLAEKLVDLGAPLTSDLVDTLVATGDALRAYDSDASGPLLSGLQDFNRLYAIEIPCIVETFEDPVKPL